MSINLTPDRYLAYLDGFRIRLDDGLLLLTGAEEDTDDDSDAKDGFSALMTRIEECQAELDKLTDEETGDDGDEGGREGAGQHVKSKIEALIIDIKMHCRAHRKQRGGSIGR